ncbi:hypothetical protein BN1723_020698, partial [Verticillium longisporum]
QEGQHADARDAGAPVPRRAGRVPHHCGCERTRRTDGRAAREIRRLVRD